METRAAKERTGSNPFEAQRSEPTLAPATPAPQIAAERGPTSVAASLDYAQPWTEGQHVSSQVPATGETAATKSDTLAARILGIRSSGPATIAVEVDKGFEHGVLRAPKMEFKITPPAETYAPVLRSIDYQLEDETTIVSFKWPIAMSGPYEKGKIELSYLAKPEERERETVSPDSKRNLERAAKRRAVSIVAPILAVKPLVDMNQYTLFTVGRGKKHGVLPPRQMVGEVVLGDGSRGLPDRFQASWYELGEETTVIHILGEYAKVKDATEAMFVPGDYAANIGPY
jgi:hypothetical protein